MEYMLRQTTANILQLFCLSRQMSFKVYRVTAAAAGVPFFSFLHPRAKSDIDHLSERRKERGPNIECIPLTTTTPIQVSVAIYSLEQ
jgi:hypothetical protein